MHGGRGNFRRAGLQRKRVVPASGSRFPNYILLLRRTRLIIVSFGENTRAGKKSGSTLPASLDCFQQNRAVWRKLFNDELVGDASQRF